MVILLPSHSPCRRQCLNTNRSPRLPDYMRYTALSGVCIHVTSSRGHFRGHLWFPHRFGSSPLVSPHGRGRSSRPRVHSPPSLWVLFVPVPDIVERRWLVFWGGVNSSEAELTVTGLFSSATLQLQHPFPGRTIGPMTDSSSGLTMLAVASILEYSSTIVTFCSHCFSFGVVGQSLSSTLPSWPCSWEKLDRNWLVSRVSPWFTLRLTSPEASRSSWEDVVWFFSSNSNWAITLPFPFVVICTFACKPSVQKWQKLAKSRFNSALLVIKVCGILGIGDNSQSLVLVPRTFNAWNSILLPPAS